MGDRIAVSWQGMGQLITHSNDQYLNLSEASGFTCAGQLADTGAFGGFLSIFRGSYTEALDAMTASLNGATTGARNLSSAIEACRDELRQRDDGVARLGNRVETTVLDGDTYQPPSGGGVPQVPGNLVNLNDLSDVDVPMDGPTPPSWVPEGNLNSPIDLVDSTASLADNAHGTGEALGHADDVEGFLEEHDR